MKIRVHRATTLSRTVAIVSKEEDTQIHAMMRVHSPKRNAPITEKYELR